MEIVTPQTHSCAPSSPIARGSPSEAFTHSVFADMSHRIDATFPSNPDVCLVRLHRTRRPTTRASLQASSSLLSILLASLLLPIALLASQASGSESNPPRSTPPQPSARAVRSAC